MQVNAAVSTVTQLPSKGYVTTQENDVESKSSGKIEGRSEASISAEAMEKLEADKQAKSLSDYDLTSISINELEDYANALFEEGKISDMEHMKMISARLIKEVAKEYAGVDYDPDDKMNYLQIEEDYLEFLLNEGASVGQDSIDFQLVFVETLRNLQEGRLNRGEV